MSRATTHERVRAARRRLGVAAVACLAACVTTYEEAPLVEESTRPRFAVAQTIPFGEAPASPEEEVLRQLYGGVLRRLQEAAEEGDGETIDGLLAAYDKAALPSWVAARFAGYRSLAGGLRFLAHARQRGQLRVVGPATAAAPPPLGEAVEFEYTLPPMAEPVELGGRMDDDPVGFAVAITVEDSFVDGSSRRYSKPDFAWLPQRHRLEGDVPVRVPVRVDLEAVGAVQRVIHLRIDLMPGYVGIDGARSPVRRTTLAAESITQWPAERAEVLTAPLANLQQGLQLGGLAGGRRAWLAALATSGDDRRTAMELLIGEVRVGRGDQAIVAMAALRAMTGANVLVGDRDGWLAWWQAQK